MLKWWITLFRLALLSVYKNVCLLLLDYLDFQNFFFLSPNKQFQYFIRDAICKNLPQENS